MADQAQTARQRVSFWKVALIATGPIALALIALAFLLPRKPSRAEIAIEAKLAELRARGVPLTASAMGQRFPDPPPENEARKVLANAFSLTLRDGTPAGLPILDGDLPERGEPIPEATMHVMRDYLTNSQSILEAVPDGLEKVRFAMGWDSGCTNPPIKFPLFEVRALVQTLALIAVYEAECGNVQATGEAIRKGFDVALTTGDDTLMTTMMKCAIARLMCDVTEQALSRTIFDDAALLSLERRIRPERVGNFEHALMGERYVGIAMLDEYRVKRRHERNRSAKDSFESMLEFFERRRKPAYRAEDYVLFLESMDARASLQAGPLLDRLQGYDRIEKEYWGKVSSNAGGEVGMTTWKTHRIAFEAKARLTVLKTALALERYRISMGRLPDSLADVPSNYLPAIPKDPFDEQPIRYKILERGYVVWSIGVDGVDDHGAERASQDATNNYDVRIIIER